jgi:hypothetical protein
LNYSDSLLFHGGDTGSTPVRDANIQKHLQDPTGANYDPGLLQLLSNK